MDEQEKKSLEKKAEEITGKIADKAKKVPKQYGFISLNRLLFFASVRKCGANF